jgi:CRISPR/Cas system CSM-associated protein Csm3 (group 7 of RAMP superfamily)
MTRNADFSTFSSRLHLKGNLVFQTGMRIGAEGSNAVDQPDLPVLRDALGRPYIPGSSFKGAFRSSLEAILRTLQEHPNVQDRNLACLSVGKPGKRAQDDPQPALCLTQDEVKQIKQARPDEWGRQVSGPLRDRLNSLDLSGLGSDDACRDHALYSLSCRTCRLFGSPWSASKVLIRDMPLQDADSWPVNIRDGVAIDRDAGRAADKMKYQFEALAPGAAFDFEMLIENASEADLGLLWMAIAAFERGEVPMGGARSRGLGWCALTLDWGSSKWVGAENLLDFLFTPDYHQDATVLSDKPAEWLASFQREIMRPA